MDLRDSGRASLRASRVLMPARTEPRPPKDTFPDSQDHARSFSQIQSPEWTTTHVVLLPPVIGVVGQRNRITFTGARAGMIPFVAITALSPSERIRNDAGGRQPSRST